MTGGFMKFAGPAILCGTDFEGRVVEREGSSLRISGESMAHVVVRWRFGGVKSVTVNGAVVKLENAEGGAFVKFDHSKESLVKWE